MWSPVCTREKGSATSPDHHPSHMRDPYKDSGLSCLLNPSRFFTSNQPMGRPRPCSVEWEGGAVCPSRNSGRGEDRGASVDHGSGGDQPVRASVRRYVA